MAVSLKGKPSFELILINDYECGFFEYISRTVYPQRVF